MKSQIHELQKNKLLRVSKKVMMLAFMVLGTAAMVNAQSAPAKTSETKEVKMDKSKKEKKKIEKSKLPKVVTETFIEEFPVITNESWFGYPRFDVERDWYFHDNKLYEIDNPEFYVVEFTKDNVKHKAVYSKAGKKIAVHKKTLELPKAITTAIEKSKYGKWKIAKEKEVIFRDTELDKIKTYKVIVENGKEKHALYYSTTGDLLKDKTIK
jgi:hypothetical protein